MPKLTDAENEAMKVLKNEMDEIRKELEVERNVNIELKDRNFELQNRLEDEILTSSSLTSNIGTMNFRNTII